MYARDVKGRTLTFGVSGQLWRRSLVMYDKETNSQWSHILGEAMAGELMGESLEQVPSLMTDWKTFREQYPQSTVLAMKPTAKVFNRDIYRNPSRFVLGIVQGDRTWAWGFDFLTDHPVENVELGDKKAVVFFDAASQTARIFDRTVGDQSLTFSRKAEQVVDDQTDSTWNIATGVAEEGELKGKHLRSLPGILSFRHTWKQFHEDSEMFPESASPGQGSS